MSSQERLNVLLSRARNGLIIIGNSETFLKSRSGKEIWSKFLDMVKRLGYFYEGLPVRCERHNNTKNVLKSPEDFEKLCPDGGCSEPWFVSTFILFHYSDHVIPRLCSGTTMNCGIHTCPRKCHDPRDHRDCTVRVKTELPCGHSANSRCHQSKAPPDACIACKLAQRKAGLDKTSEEKETGTDDRSSTSDDPRPPTSPTSSWRERQAATTTDNGTWRTGRSTNQSTGVFAKYKGPRRSTGTYEGGLFSQPKSPSDSSFYSSRGSGRGSWRK